MTLMSAQSRSSFVFPGRFHLGIGNGSGETADGIFVEYEDLDYKFIASASPQARIYLLVCHFPSPDLLW